MQKEIGSLSFNHHSTCKELKIWNPQEIMVEFDNTSTRRNEDIVFKLKA